MYDITGVLCIVCHSDIVFNVLYPGDETPEWNPQCGLNQVCVCIHVCMYVSTYVSMHVCVHSCVHVRTYVSVYVHVCMYH